MNIDENDLLATNIFIQEPKIDEINPEQVKEFEEWFSVEKNKQKENELPIKEKEKKLKEIKTYVSVDSRDRDKREYPLASNFKIFLGRTFYNVRSVKLVSLEFPNVNSVINKNNNKIYWHNLQDIENGLLDTTTGYYPVYSIELRTGSYVSNSIQDEITNKLNSVKRENKFGDNHFFIVTLDLDTDVVSMTSLSLELLGNNPLTSTISSNVIKVSAFGHGLDPTKTHELYLIGSKSFAGITTDLLNTVHTMTVNTPNELQFEVSIPATDTAVGGGNVVKLGKQTPFQFLFGSYTKTVADNLGFPLENSSKRIDTYIQSILNYKQIRILFDSNHNFTLNDIGQFCTITGINTIIPDNSSLLITEILDNRTILVNYNNNELTTTASNAGQITYGLNVYNIELILNYTVNSVLVTTSTDHYLTTSDINKVITFYDTQSTPSFNGENTIQSVLSSTEFIITGNLDTTVHLSGEVIYTNNDGGGFPQQYALEANIYNVTNVIPGVVSTFVCNNNFKVGDRIKIYNLKSYPMLKDEEYTVFSATNTEFTINKTLVEVDMNVVLNNQVYVGSNVLKLTFPNHSFNFIINIEQETYTKSGDVVVDNVLQTTVTTSTSHNLSLGDTVCFNSTVLPDIYMVTNVISTTEFEIDHIGTTQITLTNLTITKPITIQTQLNHNLTDGTIIIIQGTGTNLDGLNLTGEGFKVRVKDNDEIWIKHPYITIPVNITGTISLSQDFYLYSAQDVGGIKKEYINNEVLKIREILDENNITFQVNTFSTKNERGGGDSIFISSLLHGFRGAQTNTINNVLHRSINLEGENYAFLKCPQLSSMLNTGSVKDVFARISLDQSPGNMVFAFLSNPKTFDDVPLNRLGELEFSVINYDNSLYEFNELDYSFVLEITEEIDTSEQINVSSRRNFV